MMVVVRYMAQLRLAVGTGSESVTLPEGAVLPDLLRQLGRAHPGLLPRLLFDARGELQPSLLVFVGDSQVSPSEPRPLREGEVITLLTPIAGGGHGAVTPAH